MPSPRTEAIPLTADPTGLLPPRVPESTPNHRSAGWLYGWDFRFVVSEHIDREISHDPWPRFVARLRDGIRVHVWCTDPSPTDPTAAVHAKHVLHLHPDGTITMEDHPDATTPAGGHSDNLDHDTEVFLHSLASNTPACLSITLWLVGEQTDPGNAERIANTLGFGSNTIGVRDRIRSVYAAIAWAQPLPDDPPDAEPVWPKNAWKQYLDAGITPRTLAYWVAQGWTVNDALLFLQHRAPFRIAEQWRAVGDTSARAARFAARKETPADDTPWLAAGFTPKEAEPWRLHPRTFTPKEAWQWHHQHVRPDQARVFAVLPANNKARALAWTRAGVPCEHVIEWHRHLGDSSDALDDALTWAGKVPAQKFISIQQWNRTHPDIPLTPEYVLALARVGVPLDGNLMGVVASAGLTVGEILRPLNMLPYGKRWLGIEARLVLARATHAAYEAANGHRFADRPPVELDEPDSKGRPQQRRSFPHEFRLEQIEAGNWEWVASDMRLRHSPSPLWEPYLHWLATHPTPPSRPARPADRSD